MSHKATEAARTSKGLILERAIAIGTSARRTMYIGRMFRRSGTSESVISPTIASNPSVVKGPKLKPAAPSSLVPMCR